MSGYSIKGARSASGTPLDLHIADGRLVAGPALGAKIIEADGLLALPGLVDMHTHLREPGFEESETVASGTACAARGGFTAVFAMANTDPVTDSVERAAHIAELGRAAGNAEVFPIGSITIGLAGDRLSPIAEMAASGVRMFSDDGKCVMNSALMREALRLSSEANVIIAQHSQDHVLAGPQAAADERTVAADLGITGWPWAAESTIIARDVQLAELTGGRLHACHITTAESVEVVRWAKARGVKVTAEATPHHLLLDSELLRGLDTAFKVNPPLRGAEDIEALRSALADGTIDVVGTDHAPHDPKAKQGDFAHAKPGMLGLEQALASVIETMINTGRMDWTDLVRVMSVTPARLTGVPDQGGMLRIGEVANLVLVDPTRRAVVDRETSRSASRNNPYHGLDLPDPIEMTFYSGHLSYSRRISA
ncbi:dihydroorotase [Brooklawnia sp.]|uniref:dihydroorotase n=1 Tax=Brooklawnia sp. TaxID=2699740 RepID=UPI00311D8086